MSDTTIRISSKSTMLDHQRFYAPTYLVAKDESVMLFIGDVATVRGPSGKVRRRINTSVLPFATVEEMVDAILDGGWVEDEALDGDARRWRPPKGESGQ